MIFLQILEAKLQVDLTGISDDLLTEFFIDTRHLRIGLGKTLETIDQLGKIGGILGLDGDPQGGLNKRKRKLLKTSWKIYNFYIQYTNSKVMDC